MNHPIVVYLILILCLFNSSRYISSFIRGEVDIENILFLILNIIVIIMILIDRIKLKKSNNNRVKENATNKFS